MRVETVPASFSASTSLPSFSCTHKLHAGGRSSAVYQQTASCAAPTYPPSAAHTKASMGTQTRVRNRARVGSTDSQADVYKASCNSLGMTLRRSRSGKESSGHLVNGAGTMPYHRGQDLCLIIEASSPRPKHNPCLITGAAAHGALQCPDFAFKSSNMPSSLVSCRQLSRGMPWHEVTADVAHSGMRSQQMWHAVA
eukprot:scaffold261520_cov22-Tisochrysis_lutea.AAC.1